MTQTFSETQIEKHLRAIFTLSRDGTDDEFHTAMTGLSQVMVGICMATTTPKKLFREYLDVMQRSLKFLPDIQSEKEAAKVIGFAAVTTDGKVTEVRSGIEGVSIKPKEPIP